MHLTINNKKQIFVSCGKRKSELYFSYLYGEYYKIMAWRGQRVCNQQVGENA